MRRFDAAPRRATPKGHKTFISCTATHQASRLPTSDSSLRAWRTNTGDFRRLGSSGVLLSSCPVPVVEGFRGAAPSLLAAERRFVLLSGRIVCLLVGECCGLGERGGAGPGREVAVEPALPDAPLRPLRQQAERRVSVAGEVALTDQVRRHLDPVR